MAAKPTSSGLSSLDHRIILLRGDRVMLSVDLARLYGVEPRTLVQAVRRNQDRFPSDFMFELSSEEWRNLRSQFVISSWGGSRYPPLAFTEHGIAMLSSVLRSPRAVRVNIEIMRAFIRLRRLALSHDELSRRLDDLEERYDGQFKIVFAAIRKLMEPPPPTPRPRIGF